MVSIKSCGSGLQPRRFGNAKYSLKVSGLKPPTHRCLISLPDGSAGFDVVFDIND